jgi:hypothetical protein
MKTATQSLAAKHHPALAYLWMLLLAAQVGAISTVVAEPVGKVVNLSDPSQLLAKKADGTIKVLSQNSIVETGDALESRGNTYARIKFLDGGEVTLAPDTQFKIDSYTYDKEKPKEDRSIFTLIKGTLRSITGDIGHRNNDRYQLNTPTATIGIRGTTYLAKYVNEESPELASDKKDKKIDCDDRHPRLIVQVIGGVIYLKNDGGNQTYASGQYGCATSYQQAPLILTTNPGLEFNPLYGRALQCRV